MPDGHLTLRQRCEKAAVKAMGHTNDACAQVVCGACCEVADAIERVAREFARDALLVRMRGGLPDLPEHRERFEREREPAISSAIEAAARGEDE